jgi:hypothetical protein
VDIQIYPINCNNFNLNVNDASVNIDRPQTGDFTSLETSPEVGDEGVTLNSFENVERNNEFKKFDKDFAFICINNNNNEGISGTGDLCPEGFTFVNGQCQMVETVQATCPDGTPATSDTCTVTETTTVPAVCPAGFTGPNAQGVCTGTTTQQATCPDGTPATSDTCTVTEITTVPAQCPAGYSGPDATGECQRTITQPPNE